MSDRPTGLYWEEYIVGDKVKTPARTITETDVVNFGTMTGDMNPLHMNAEFAKTTVIGERIAHGALTFSYAVGLMSQLRRGEGTVIAYAGLTIKYTAPVKLGDTIHCEITVADKKETKKPDRGLVMQQVNVVNQNGIVVAELMCTYMVRKMPV